VINLAAGLDTRAWRLALPATLQWFDVDLPAITAYKQEIMRGEQPVCRYEAVAADLTDDTTRDTILRRLGGVGRTVLVVSEGLLVYLTAEQVAVLARALRAVPSTKWWIADLANPMLLEWMVRKWGKGVSEGRAPFQFAPADPRAFFGALGWRLTMFRSGMEEAQRLRREMRGMWLMRAISRLYSAKRREAVRTMNGFYMFERADITR
jgi:O-Methyltransferase involved in polyketide biosynthesis